MKTKLSKKESEFVLLLARNYLFSSYPETIHNVKLNDRARNIIAKIETNWYTGVVDEADKGVDMAYYKKEL